MTANVPLVAKVALTPSDVWNTLADMGGSDSKGVDALQASMRGMAGAETVEDAKKSQGGSVALDFFDSQSHATSQAGVPGGVRVISRMLLTVNPSSRVSGRAACTLCG
eukprot:jgi/Mesvir1/21640/Mv04062-RA.1